MPPPTPNQVKYTLKKPVILYSPDGAEIQRVTELTLRTDVVAGDLRGMPLRSPPWAEDILRLLSRLSGHPDAVCNRISSPDFVELAVMVSDFMEGSQAPESEAPGTAGTTPSP